MIGLLDIADTCCSVQLLRHYLITHFGDFDSLHAYPPRSLLGAKFAVVAITIFLVHIFFASQLVLVNCRINWWFAGFIILCSVAMIVSGLCILIYPMHWHRQTNTSSDFHSKILMTAFHSLAVSVDVLVTIGLCVMFSPGKTEFKQTNIALRQLIVSCITRGILTTLLQISHIVMFLVNPSNLLFWMPLNLFLSKLYTITTLVILNSRPSRRAKLDETAILGAVPMAFAHPESNLDISEAHHWIARVPTPSDQDSTCGR